MTNKSFSSPMRQQLRHAAKRSASRDERRRTICFLSSPLTLSFCQPRLHCRRQRRRRRCYHHPRQHSRCHFRRAWNEAGVIPSQKAALQRENRRRCKDLLRLSGDDVDGNIAIGVVIESHGVVTSAVVVVVADGDGAVTSVRAVVVVMVVVFVVLLVAFIVVLSALSSSSLSSSSSSSSFPATVITRGVMVVKERKSFPANRCLTSTFQLF